MERPPFHIAISLEGAADLALPPHAPVLLHTEQDGYTPAPHPPTFGEGSVSFSRPGAAVVRAE